MGVSRRVAEVLRRAGYDIVHASELGLARSPDRELLERAASDRRTLVTFDLDFAEIASQAPQNTSGVILLRLRNASNEWVLRRLRIVLGACREELRAGAIVSVGDSRYRVREFANRR
jgi:predicted nuclease of predicted toxin-antitoxin system